MPFVVLLTARTYSKTAGRTAKGDWWSVPCLIDRLFTIIRHLTWAISVPYYG